MKYHLQSGLIALIFIVVVVAICGFAAPVPLRAMDEAKAEQFQEAEQVKIFSAGVGDMEKLEKEVNAWLKENDGKIYIYSRTQSGTQFGVQIAIWYKVRK
ncbi:MAG: hypothetical protein G01um10143_363 [Parcubacteria group bacterium Gr01-1014_3]|nr:MAG: hypothetical protein G01um10143_363 [Parcubacteria group bacterium Gr01-1014_3]